MGKVFCGLLVYGGNTAQYQNNSEKGDLYGVLHGSDATRPPVHTITTKRTK